MATRLIFLLGLTLAVVGTCACEKLAGIEEKHLAATGIVDAGPTACQIASTSGTGLRVAHMVPVQQPLDICVRPTGGQFPQLPLLASGGPGCSSGINYGQYTVPLNLPGSGPFDVKLVPQSSDCNADGPAVTGVTVSDDASTTVVAYGSDLQSATLASLADADKSNSDILIRFFHALNGEGTLEAGLANNVTPQATIIRTIFTDVPFGAISQASPIGVTTFPVDSRGYMDYGTTSDVGGLPMGASRAETATSAIVAAYMSLATSHHYTLFLMGVSGQVSIDTSGQPTYPSKLWACDEGASDGLFAQCGNPSSLVVSIFQPNLTDAFTGYIDVREKPALDAIENETADILCLPELYSPQVQQDLKDRVAQMSGVTAYFSDDPTIVSGGDLTDMQGTLPTYPDPTCDETSVPLMSNFETCLLSMGQPCVGYSQADASDGLHYFTVPGSLGIGCVSQSCLSPVNDFVNAGSHAADACFMCAIAHLSSHESIEGTYAECTTPNGGKPQYVFNGSTGLALLTRFNLAPGEKPEVVLLPASTWNRAALRVPLELPNKSIIDIWCAEVRAPNSEPYLLNGGPYHGDASGGDSLGGNSAEELLQIRRLVATVDAHAQANQRRAIVAALTNTSPQILDPQDNVLVTGLVTDNFAYFQDQKPLWAELVAPSFIPSCDFCGDNPLNGPTDNLWTLHMFGVGIGADTVTRTQRTFTARTLSVQLYGSSDNEQTPVPVSQYYGIQSTVRVTQ